MDVGDRVTVGYGKHRSYGTVSEVLNRSYVNVEWDDGSPKSHSVFVKDIKRVPTKGASSDA